MKLLVRSRGRAIAAGVLLAVVAPSCARAPVPPQASTAGRTDARFAEAFARVEQWVGKGAFPGAVLAVGDVNGVLALRSCGRIEIG
jgi:serine-type D-Ala-D-Ala carboxypeptidase